MRPVKDRDNQKLVAVLTQLYESGSQITVRAVARLHPELKDASAFSRSATRMALVKTWQVKQETQQAGLGPQSPHPEADKLLAALERVQLLENQLAALVASHAGCIRAVISCGGFAGLERFWDSYSSVKSAIHELGLYPSLASVSTIVTERR